MESAKTYIKELRTKKSITPQRKAILRTKVNNLNSTQIKDLIVFATINRPTRKSLIEDNGPGSWWDVYTVLRLEFEERKNPQERGRFD